jgi:hypothetical protein
MDYVHEPCWEADMLDSNKRLLVRKYVNNNIIHAYLLMLFRNRHKNITFETFISPQFIDMQFVCVLAKMFIRYCCK